MIATQNDKATGNLFMYRDSFGNALLPYFANAYNSAYFTKTFPINLSLEVMSRNSDTVVFEIAERNLIWFAQNPPVLPAREFTVPKTQRLLTTSLRLMQKFRKSICSMSMFRAVLIKSFARITVKLLFL